MRVLVDTSVWSLALRRVDVASPHAAELTQLLRTTNAVLLGAVRQEILSGINDAKRFETLRAQLRSVVDHPISTTHYEKAAECFNTCRGRGIQGGPIDYLVCAVAIVDQMPIYTTDRDFEHFARHLPLQLYSPRHRGP